ncbi:MAG TPA: LPS export ABC transporter permease LptF [Burkholderiales bacterium]|nr:LPS export ABC transporter permease LptF [Pseudomonadota bacterium]HVC49552.1 LPS export ABC transporter permease LptF [Burkholderiales bacterium]
MIFRQALVNELARSVALIFTVLMAITLTIFIVRLLGDAAGGVIQPNEFLSFLGFTLLNYIPVVISLTLFIGILMTLNRSYRDSEMTVWFSSGLDVTHWIGPVLYFIFPVVAALAILSLVLSPWAASENAKYLSFMQSRTDLSMITPGVFRESGAQDRVYFVDSLSANHQEVRNIFVQSRKAGKISIVVASRGYHRSLPNGIEYLELDNGRRYDGEPGKLDYQVMSFKHYDLYLQPRASAVNPTAKATSTIKLMHTPTADAQAELQWRLSKPISALILALLAIPLAAVNPRTGKSWHFLLALLIFMIYANLLSISDTWVEQGKLSPAIGLWWVHLLMLALAGYLFYRRLFLVSWFRRRHR